ncbi:hypothetical protein PENTCL1PPCAC_44, partial [Pristionchus entomophagus]
LIPQPNKLQISLTIFLGECNGSGDGQTEHRQGRHAAKSSEDLILPLPSLHDFRVRNASEGYHRVERNPRLRKPSVQCEIQLLPEFVAGVIDEVTELLVVVHGEVVDGVCVVDTSGGVEGDCLVNVIFCLVESVFEYEAVLESTIHSLSVEGHHSMGSVPCKHDAPAEVMGGALERHQRLDPDLGETSDQRFRCDELERIREVFLEEGDLLLLVAQLFLEDVEWAEKSDGERLVPVRQCDESEYSSWPEVEHVGLESELSIFGKNGQLDVAMLYVFL